MVAVDLAAGDAGKIWLAPTAVLPFLAIAFGSSIASRSSRMRTHVFGLPAASTAALTLAMSALTRRFRTQSESLLFILARANKASVLSSSGAFLVPSTYSLGSRQG